MPVQRKGSFGAGRFAVLDIAGSDLFRAAFETGLPWKLPAGDTGTRPRAGAGAAPCYPPFVLPRASRDAPQTPMRGWYLFAMSTEQQQFEAAIATLETQRAVLGRDVPGNVAIEARALAAPPVLPDEPVPAIPLPR